MGTSLIRGKYIICQITNRTTAEVIVDGAVVQRDGVIIDVGPYQDMASRYQPDDVLGSAEHIVMPGLVNSHHHVGLTPFQLGSPDYPLELWFASRLGARPVDPYLDTLYSAFEMLESGITTVQHLHGWRIGPASQVLAVADQILQAYRDLGMRVSYSFALRDQNRLVYEADDRFLSRLPPQIAAALTPWLQAQSMPYQDHLAIFAQLWNTGTVTSASESSWRQRIYTGAPTRRCRRCRRMPRNMVSVCTCIYWRRPIRRNTRAVGPAPRLYGISMIVACSDLT